METRLCVVGKQNGENKELMQAIEVNTSIGSEFFFLVLLKYVYVSVIAIRGASLYVLAFNSGFIAQ